MFGFMKKQPDFLNINEYNSFLLALKGGYEECKNNTENISYLFDNILGILAEWETIYPEAVKLYNNQKFFPASNKEVVDTIYSEIAYYYAFTLLKTGYYDKETIDLNKRNSNLDKAKKVVRKFNEPKFKLIQGAADFQQGELLKEGKFGPYELKALEDKRYSAKWGLLEIKKYDSADILRIWLESAVEYNMYQSAFWDLYSFFLYTAKNKQEAFNLLNGELEKLDECCDTLQATGLTTPKMVDDLRDELINLRNN